MSRKHVLVLGTIAVFALSPISAQAMEWTVGLGAGLAPDYEGSEDYEPVPLWNIRAANLYHPSTYVQVIGPKLNSNLLADDNLRLGLSAQYVLERDDVDNNQVDALRAGDDGLLVGLLLGYDFMLSGNRVLGFEFDPRYDVSDEIGGLFTLRMKYMAPLGADWRFRGGVESTYASEDYMSEFFGVSAADSVRSGLPVFDADHGFKDVGISAGVTYLITPSWSTTLTAKYTRLLGDAADSPVVDNVGDENQWFGGLRIDFHF